MNADAKSAKDSTKAQATKKAPAAKKAPVAKKAEAAEPEPTVHEIEDDLWGGDWDDLGGFGDASGDAAADTGAPRREPTHQWANESIELFQNAALELIAAARTALDTAEDLVTDPQAVGVALESLRDLAGEFVRSARPGMRGRPATFDDDDFQTIRVEE